MSAQIGMRDPSERGANANLYQLRLALLRRTSGGVAAARGACAVQSSDDKHSNNGSRKLRVDNANRLVWNCRILAVHLAAGELVIHLKP